MKNTLEFDAKKIMRLAEADPQYCQLLKYYKETEQYYRQVSECLSQEDTAVIEQYLTAGEAVYYRFSQIAYQYGKRSRKS